MRKNKQSFFERLTGSATIKEDDEFVSFGEEKKKLEKESLENMNNDEWLEEEEEAQLTIDLLQDHEYIIIQSMLAGVKPEDLDVEISQEMITIRGKRKNPHGGQKQEDYYCQELYWGPFSRSVLLPQEVDTEKSEASLKEGLLIIKLPKVDKERKQKLKIKSS
ncbi:MAG: Hsp20/alpha crystallin family protein [Parcubacteria group bacterium]|nr:Hsp20/alpha crystallin family protein [Parcubacteria group bacterium]MCR4342926.1 Hsp20/alpha crystallin family protein [Patescibacteria group bacterium]